eukprot:UN0057
MLAVARWPLQMWRVKAICVSDPGAALEPVLPHELVEDVRLGVDPRVRMTPLEGARLDLGLRASRLGRVGAHQHDVSGGILEAARKMVGEPRHVQHTSGDARKGRPEGLPHVRVTVNRQRHPAELVRAPEQAPLLRSGGVVF